MDDSFQVEQTSLWMEYAPTETEPKTIQTTVESVDQQVQALTADARKAQFEADCLALARDLAQVGQLFKEQAKSDQAARVERVTHLRGQNCIGAALVAEHMSANMAVHAGPSKDQVSVAERVGGCPNTSYLNI